MLIWLKKVQAWCLTFVRQTWGLTLAALAAAAAAAAAVVPTLHSELIPQFREGHFVVQMSMTAPGTSVADVMEIGERISKDILQNFPISPPSAIRSAGPNSGEDTW